MKKRDNESLRHEKLHIFYYGSILNWALDPWGNERELFSVRLAATEREREKERERVINTLQSCYFHNILCAI